jgi:CRP-like cAMP-binding protein
MDSGTPAALQAITAATVRAIPVSHLAEVCRQDAAFAEHILRQIGRQLGAAQAQLATVGAQSADQKLATFLLSIADLCNVSPAGDFDLPMRRGDMAEFRLRGTIRARCRFCLPRLDHHDLAHHCRLVRREVLEDLAAGGI